MKKKITLLLSLVMLLAFSLSACGTDPKDVDYNGKTYDELASEIENAVYAMPATDELITMYNTASTDQLSAERILEDEDLQDAVVSYLATYDQISTTSEVFVGLEKWDEMEEEWGLWQEDNVNMDTFKVDKAGKTTTTQVTLAFEKKDVTFQLVYDSYSMEITGVSIDPNYSMSEKLSKAGLNTLISMAIVFCVLILISLIIYAFNIFPYLEAKKKAATAKEPARVKDTDVVSQIAKRESQQSTEVTEDTELIAVIAAAIAASEGRPASDFVVRSINRR